MAHAVNTEQLKLLIIHVGASCVVFLSISSRKADGQVIVCGSIVCRPSGSVA